MCHVFYFELLVVMQYIPSHDHCWCQVVIIKYFLSRVIVKSRYKSRILSVVTSHTLGSDVQLHSCKASRRFKKLSPTKSLIWKSNIRFSVCHYGGPNTEPCGKPNSLYENSPALDIVVILLWDDLARSYHHGPKIDLRGIPKSNVKF